MPEVRSNGVIGDTFMSNIRAYHADTRHFIEKEDLVYAFEAIVWAWAWLESGVEAGALSCLLLSCAALTRPTNKGAGFSRPDLNSGWNWLARK